MASNERPGVYSSYEVASTLTGAAAGLGVGVTARAENGTAARLYEIDDYAQAVSSFGASSQLTGLIRLLLRNGAAKVYAVPAAVSAAPDTAAYTAAFAVLAAEPTVKIMVCGSRDAAVHEAMQDSIEGAGESCKYRIGVVESSGTASAAVTAAAALNSERMVMVAPIETGTAALAGSAAAALAGAIAATTDPALPMNGVELEGLETLGGNFTDTQIDTLIQGGVTPLESVGGQVQVVRAVTTRTTTAGAADATWRELTTVRIIDDVLPGLRTALRARFSRAKNNARTREAIRTQVIIELQNKVEQEIIDSYDQVTVTASAQDATVCLVSFDFAVAHGLNRIRLTAHITV